MLRLLFMVLIWLVVVRVVIMILLKWSQLCVWRWDRPILHGSWMSARSDIVLSMEAVLVLLLLLLLWMWVLLPLFPILLLLVLHLRVNNGLLPPPLGQ